MYTIEYTSHVSGGFGYHMDVFDKTLEADSIFDVLSFIKSNFVMDCDYVTVNSIFCGNRELDIDELYHYVERFSWADWDYWHHPEGGICPFRLTRWYTRWTIRKMSTTRARIEYTSTEHLTMHAHRLWKKLVPYWTFYRARGTL